MLQGMTVAEAADQTAFILEEEATDRLWQAWLGGAGRATKPGERDRSFDQYLADSKKRAKAAPAAPVARPLRVGEEAATLEFAARFVKFKGGNADG